MGNLPYCLNEPSSQGANLEPTYSVDGTPNLQIFGEDAVDAEFAFGLEAADIFARSTAAAYEFSKNLTSLRDNEFSWVTEFNGIKVRSTLRHKNWGENYIGLPTFDYSAKYADRSNFSEKVIFHCSIEEDFFINAASDAAVVLMRKNSPLTGRLIEIFRCFRLMLEQTMHPKFMLGGNMETAGCVFSSGGRLLDPPHVKTVHNEYSLADMLEDGENLSYFSLKRFITGRLDRWLKEALLETSNLSFERGLGYNTSASKVARPTAPNDVKDQSKTQTPTPGGTGKSENLTPQTDAPEVLSESFTGALNRELFAKIFAHVKRSTGWSLRKIADKSGVSHTDVKRILEGDAALDTAVKALEGIGAEIDDINITLPKNFDM